MLVVREFLFLFVLHLSFLLKALIISVTLENKSISLLEETNFRAKSKVKPVCVCVCVCAWRSMAGVNALSMCIKIGLGKKNRPQSGRIFLRSCVLQEEGEVTKEAQEGRDL